MWQFPLKFVCDSQHSHKKSDQTQTHISHRKLNQRVKLIIYNELGRVFVGVVLGHSVLAALELCVVCGCRDFQCHLKLLLTLVCVILG